MTSILTIGTIIWFIGAAVAWFQIKRWNENNTFTFPDDYIMLTILSISLSWLIYPIHAIDNYTE